MLSSIVFSLLISASPVNLSSGDSVSILCASAPVCPPPVVCPAPITTYLSDLTPKSIASGWGPIEKDMSNGEQSQGDGHTLIIKGKTYAKGVGTHAFSSIHYSLLGNYTTFTSDIGVDDEVVPVSNCPGTVNFKINLDGKSVYDSGKITKGDAAKSIQINLIGAQDMELAVTDAGDGAACDHADWADAKLISSVPVVNTASASQPVPTPVPVPTPNPLPLPTPPGAYGADLTIPTGYNSSVCLLGEDDSAPGPKSSSLPLTVLKSGTYPLRDFSNGCFVADVSGKVIFDGNGGPGKVHISNAIVRGIVVQNVINQGLQGNGAVIIVNSNSKLVDSVIQDNQSVGISFPASSPTALPSNVSMIRTISQRNGYMGIGGGILHGLIKNSISRFNNHGYTNPPWKGDGAAKLTTTTANKTPLYYIAPAWEAGGGKIVFSDDLLIDHFTGDDNGGPGLWLDVYDKSVRFTNGEFFNNFGISGQTWAGQGLTTELTYGPVLFDHNYAHDNEGSEIAVMETFNATVSNNTMGKHGLELRDGCHNGDNGPAADSALLLNKDWNIRNLLVTGNAFTLGSNIGHDSGVCGVTLNPSLYSQYNIVVQNNTFK